MNAVERAAFKHNRTFSVKEKLCTIELTIPLHTFIFVFHFFFFLLCVDVFVQLSRFFTNVLTTFNKWILV